MVRGVIGGCVWSGAITLAVSGTWGTSIPRVPS